MLIKRTKLHGEIQASVNDIIEEIADCLIKQEMWRPLLSIFG